MQDDAARDPAENDGLRMGLPIIPCRSCVTGDRRGDEPPDWMADKQRRLEAIRAAKAALEPEAASARSGR